MIERDIVFDGVSRFYGEVLGVNRVSLRIPPGISSLVGPNGSGKTTLMNLMTGLIAPDRGTISVCGISPRNPEELMRVVGYATQYDSSPRGATGFEFVSTALRLAGRTVKDAHELARNAIEQLDLTDAAERKIAGYSKGMRQRIRLAQAIAHDPKVLILDEPLNGLDPLVRAETIALFEKLAARGRHVVISSHVLHEVDVISDHVILVANGTIIAEGGVRGVRDEIDEHPRQYLVRCKRASAVAALLFEQDHVTQVQIHEDRLGLLVMTRNQSEFSRTLQRLALNGHPIESVMAADENVDALYRYLIGGGA